MDVMQYTLKMLEAQREEIINPHPDKDIHNLKMMLFDITPYSRAWRFGYVKSLKRAITALEKENKCGGE